MDIKTGIYKAISTFGVGIITEKRLINILNDYGVFKDNMAYRPVLSDMLKINMFAPVLSCSIDDILKSRFNQSIICNFLASYPYQEKVVNEITDTVVGTYVVANNAESIDYWLHVMKDKQPQNFHHITSHKNKVNIFKFQKKLNDFGLMDLDGKVSIPYVVLGSNSKYEVYYSNPRSFFDKWNIRDVYPLFFFSSLCISRKERIEDVLKNGRILRWTLLSQENATYMWYYEYLREKEEYRVKNSFENRLQQCKDLKLNIIKVLFSDKNSDNITVQDIKYILIEQGLMNNEGKVLNIAPGTECFHMKKCHTINGEWKNLFEFVRLLYFAKLLKEQGIQFTMTKYNMNKILQKAHDKALEEDLKINEYIQ